MDILPNDVIYIVYKLLNSENLSHVHAHFFEVTQNLKYKIDLAYTVTGKYNDLYDYSHTTYERCNDCFFWQLVTKREGLPDMECPNCQRCRWLGFESIKESLNETVNTDIMLNLIGHGYEN